MDPAISKDVLKYLDSDKEHSDLLISTVMITHKHWDHCGEVNELVKELEERNK